jgi:hypothetical protein
MAQFEWYWILIPLVVIAGFWYFSQAQTLNPLDVSNTVPCSDFGKASGVCLKSTQNAVVGEIAVGTPGQGWFTRDGQLLCSAQNTCKATGYSGTSAPIYVGQMTEYYPNEAQVRPALDLKLQSFNTVMAGSGVGVGSLCEVNIKIRQETYNNLYVRDLPTANYPANAGPTDWLQGTLVADTAVNYGGGSNLLWISGGWLSGTTGYYATYIPYKCQTSFNYPALSLPTTWTDGSSTRVVEENLYTQSVRIYQSSSCVTRTALGGYISQWVSGAITRDALGGYIMQWVGC